METEKTIISEHSNLAAKLLRNLENFVDEVGKRGCTTHFGDVLANGDRLEGVDLTQEPERFTEDHLIFPVLRSLGHDYRARPTRYAPRWPDKRGTPDFALETLPVEVAKRNDIRLFGEAKAPNRLGDAHNDVREYLASDLDYHAVVFLTDGIEWELWTRPRGADGGHRVPVAKASLSSALETVLRRNKECETYVRHDVREDLDEVTFEGFLSDDVLEIVEEQFGVQCR